MAAFYLLTIHVERETILLPSVVTHLAAMTRMLRTRRFDLSEVVSYVNDVLISASCRRTNQSTSSRLHLQRELDEGSVKQLVQMHLQSFQ